MLALLLALAAPAPAPAATRFTIHGAGFGHGIGMSQYGAQGYARHGYRYARILAHYYTGTRLGAISPNTRVRVLLTSGNRTVTVTHATRVSGMRLRASLTYLAVPSRGRVLVRAVGARKPVGRFSSAAFSGRGYTVMAERSDFGLAGGGWRGTLRVTPAGDVVNELGVDDYVRGIVGVEESPSWRPEALKAQAVAARTYAITAGGAGSILYDDTRSQAYGGVARESPTTDAAVRATRGQVVTYHGVPVVTFFFSTSGGRTENIEDSFLGSAPEPWLKSVPDPYDTISPLHRWTLRMSFARAARELGPNVRGRLRGIRVLERGRSPRIVRAQVVGTRGVTTVTGSILRSAFGAYDTWMSFTAIETKKAKPKRGGSGGGSGSGGGKGGGAAPARVARLPSPPLPGLAGTVMAPTRSASVERRTGRRWVRVARVRLRRGGRYAWAARRPGVYRIRAAGDPGPAVTLTRP